MASLAISTKHVRNHTISIQAYPEDFNVLTLFHEARIILIPTPKTLQERYKLVSLLNIDAKS